MGLSDDGDPTRPTPTISRTGLAKSPVGTALPVVVSREPIGRLPISTIGLVGTAPVGVCVLQLRWHLPMRTTTKNWPPAPTRQPIHPSPHAWFPAKGSWVEAWVPGVRPLSSGGQQRERRGGMDEIGGEGCFI